MTTRLTIILSIFCGYILAQDTLILAHRKNLTREFKIPFGQYNINVKTHDKKFNALLIGYKDSNFVFKIKNNNRKVRKQISKIYRAAWDTASLLQLSKERLDSLMISVKNKENEILYPTKISVNLSQIQKFKIDNSNRPEKKRLIKTLRTVGCLTLAAMLISPVSVVFAPLTAVPFIILPIYGAGIIWVIADVILETERLDFKNKWTVKSTIKT